ncbi:MAG: putative MATE family efflux protein [Candidatus Endobugula sp.]|jgi:putative MATE family efflux protein
MAKYTQGSINQHLLVMTASATTGLIVIFLSDLVDIYFLSLLGEIEIIAALGFAGSVIFFTVSLNIGLAIACSALVSRALGSGDMCASREVITYSFVSAMILTMPISFLIFLGLPHLLEFLGASGQALIFATQYLHIINPSTPILALVMSAGGVLRARGDAKEAMWLTVMGGIVNIVLDPIFIFGFGMGVDGAAIATVLSRVAMLAFAIYIIVYRYRLLGAFVMSRYVGQFTAYLRVAIPAVLTNLATPIGVAYVTYTLAQFGDNTVAGNAIVSRLQPVAFAGLFALSAVVGPIAGQNFGANKLRRVRATLHESIRLVFIYCLTISAILWVGESYIVSLFNASNEAEELVSLFCKGISLMFIFNGLTFTTNALFNNLGVAHYATIINVLKVTVGTIPFVYFGIEIGGAKGAYWGLFIGSVVMGIAGWILALRLLKKLNC